MIMARVKSERQIREEGIKKKVDYIPIILIIALLFVALIIYYSLISISKGTLIVLCNHLNAKKNIVILKSLQVN